MSDNSDEKLESMLRARRVAKAPPELAQSIILRAQALPQRSPISLWQGINDIFAEFHLRKPAYVIAGALVLGMVVGFNAPRDASAPPHRSVAQGFLSSDEGFL